LIFAVGCDKDPSVVSRGRRFHWPGSCWGRGDRRGLRQQLDFQFEQRLARGRRRQPLRQGIRDGRLERRRAEGLPAVGLPLAIFLLRNFFVGIPAELLEAARIDGASEILIFARLVLPLSWPAAASLAIPLVVFFAFQRYFVQGLLAGSVK